MSWLGGLRARMRDMIWRSAADARTEEEFRFHLEMQRARQVQDGMQAVEARRSAALAFGSVESHREHMRDARRVILLEDLWRDTRHAARALRRVPGFSLICILTLALGTGLTAAMFSILYGVLFRGLPYEGAERMMYVSHSIRARGETGMGIPLRNYAAYAAQQRSFDGLGAVLPTEVTVSGGDAAERVRGARISVSTFDLLSVQPTLGRRFTADEERGVGERVVLLGDGLWRNRYGADPQVLGRRIRIDGEPATVIGVMPPDFTFPERQQLWLPLGADPLSASVGTMAVALFGRLHPGVSSDAAAAALTEVAARTAQPGDPEVRVAVRPFVDYVLGEGPRALLYTMFGAVLFVLLIACTNVANLLLSRSVVRSREVAIRSALGAGRLRVVLQFLSEAWLLALAGAAVGVLIAYGGIAAFENGVAAQLPPWMVIRMDLPVLLFAIGITAVTALLGGLLPALQASRTDVRAVIGDEGRGTSSFRIGRTSRALVMFEVALSCGLLVAAGLTTRSMVALRNVDLGFESGPIFTASVMLPRGSWPDSALPAAYARLGEELQRVGGFAAVGLGTSLPGLGGGTMPFEVDGAAPERVESRRRTMYVVADGPYLETLDAAPLAGRLFTEQDRATSPPVALVSADFAAAQFPDGAIGRRIRLGDDDGAPWRTVVGVLPEVRFGELAGSNETELVMIPLAQQDAQRRLTIMGRTRGEALAVTAAVRGAIAAVDADLPLENVGTLRAAIDRDTWFFNVFGGVFTVFGMAALSMAMVGLYGVMAFAVSQRTREIGIRMALGATAAQIRALVLRQGLAQVLIGMIAGLAFAAVVSNLLAVILFGVEPRDPLIFGGVVAALALAALLACLIPARRATCVHPVRALST